jgi:hypothetical protein
MGETCQVILTLFRLKTCFRRQKPVWKWTAQACPQWPKDQAAVTSNETVVNATEFVPQPKPE